MDQLLDSRIKSGTTIIFYNKWTNFKKDEISKCFREIDEKEKRSLKKGDFIWRDEQPYNYYGAVYGYTLRKIIRKVKNGFQMDYGSFSFSDNQKIYKIKNGKFKKLSKFIKMNPKCIDTISPIFW